MGDDHDRIGEVRGLDVGDDRRDFVVDGERPEVGGLAVAAGQVDRERGPSRYGSSRSQNRAVEPPPWIKT